MIAFTVTSLEEPAPVFPSFAGLISDDVVRTASDGLLGALRPLHYAKVDRKLKAQGQALADRFFRQAETMGELMMFADGAVLCGAKIEVFRDVLRAGWITRFWPAARWVEPPEASLALGFFEEFDLYLVDQGPMPATIVARYGAGPAYLSANPTLLSRAQVEASGPPFIEAMIRLDRLGFTPAP